MAAKVLAGWQHGRAKQVPTARRHQGHTKSDAHKTTLVAAAINGAETVGTPQAVMRGPSPLERHRVLQRDGNAACGCTDAVPNNMNLA